MGDSSHMELNKAQYQVVSWGRNSPSTRPCWRHPAEAARQRSPAGASGHQADHEPDMCQPHGKLTVCWAALSNVMPGGGGGNPSPLFSTSEAILGELGLVLASPVQETWSHWREASKGARKQGRDWSKCTMRKPERAGTAWPGEREVQGHLINVYKCPGVGRMKTEPGRAPRCPVPGQEAMGTNWNTRGFLPNVRKRFRAVRVAEQWHSCTEELRGLLGDLHKPLGHGSGHPALGVLLGQRADRRTRRCLPTAAAP